MTFCSRKYYGLLLVGTLSMMAEFLMGLSDSVVIGHLLGETALAGLNLVQPALNLVSFMANLLGVGTAVWFSLETGRYDTVRANEMFSTGLIGAVLTGLLLVTGFYFGRDAYIRCLGATSDVIAYSVPYWNWFAPCACLEIVTILLMSVCYAEGDGRTCMISYAVEVVGNIGFSIVAVRYMGIAGAGLGTTIGNILSIAVLLTHFRKPSNTLSFVWHFTLRDFSRICWSAFGDASIRLCWAALFFLLNRYVIVRYGSGMLPVLSVVVVLIGFTEVFNGVSTAAQPLVGVYMGENNTIGVRTVMCAANRVSIVSGIAISLILLAFPMLAVGLVGIREPALVALSCTAVRLSACGLIFMSLATLWNSYYIFIGHEGLSTLLTFLSNLGVMLPVAPAMDSLFGLNGLWASVAISPLLALLLFAAVIAFRHGPAMFPFVIDRSREGKMRVYGLELGKESICTLSQQVLDTLKGVGLDHSVAARAAFLVEEVFMLVWERNAKRRVLAELTLDFNEDVMITLRDDGLVFDLTDSDANISSFRSYIVSSLMEHQHDRRNLTTTGYNRNVFRLQRFCPQSAE